MKRFLLPLLLLFFVSDVQGTTFEWTGNCKAAYRNLWQLNFSATTVYLDAEKVSNPENAAVLYVEHYRDFLKAFISEEETDFQQVKNNIDRRLSAIDKLEGNSAWKNMARGEMLLQLAVIKLKRKEYLSAGYYIRRSYKLLDENHQQYPQFIPNLKSLGFLHAVIGAVPENYKWLSSLAGLKGTIATGGNELSNLVRQLESDDEFSFLRTETAFIKIFIATHFEKDFDEANSLIVKVKKWENASNPLLVFMEANTFLAAGKPGDALITLKNFKSNSESYNLYYLDYMRGMLKLNNLDFDCGNDFSRFLNNFKGKSFIRSANLKMAWLFLLKNDMKGYEQYLSRIPLSGDDFTDEDKQAMKEALSKEVPNRYLLRARLLFDGGNYNASLGELAGKPTSYFPTYKDQLEYTYRLARIFDKKGQLDKAIQYYTTTYQNGMRTEWYFAANSALNIGIIYENQNNKQLATEWYKKCLALRNHEYQNSIDQKAEGGLNRTSD